jgi:hypothetical protein
VFLEYYQNSFSKTPDASNKIIVKVLATTVSISRIGDAGDFFIELTNNATSDIDVSNWQIRASGKIFTLPKNSVIMSKKAMTIPGKVNGLISSRDLKLYSSTGELIYDYNNQYVPTNSSVENNNSAKADPALVENIQNEKIVLADTEINSENKISNNDLLANAESSSQGKNSFLFIILLVVLLVFSGLAVYFIRQKKNVVAEGDNFEILDE